MQQPALVEGPSPRLPLETAQEVAGVVLQALSRKAYVLVHLPRRPVTAEAVVLPLSPQVTVLPTAAVIRQELVVPRQLPTNGRAIALKPRAIAAVQAGPADPV